MLGNAPRNAVHSLARFDTRAQSREKILDDANESDAFETFDSPDTIRASFGPTVCMLPMLLLIVDDDDDVEDEVSYKLK
ncbi:hypothetical protein RP20_CCG020918 [Aedes albopictus]|nr:hypothetical protein RP20_CCG020918 [Aedes albopictus]